MNTTLSYALDDILTYKLDIKAAINAKGGDAGDTLSYYATAISNLPTSPQRSRWPDGVTCQASAPSVDWSQFDTSNVTDMHNMFASCDTSNMTNLSYFDTSSATNMGAMFYDISVNGCINEYDQQTGDLISSYLPFDLSQFDTSNVTNMISMFNYCQYLTYLDVSSFNTYNVTDMNGMFSTCNHLTHLDLSSFNTYNVTDMHSMFSNCGRLTYLDVSSFNTSNVQNMNGMFANCSSLTYLDLSSFNTSNVTNMEYMFYDSPYLTYINVSSFNTSNVTSMYHMFHCHRLSYIDLSSFDYTNVQVMEGMFYDSTATLINLSNANFATDDSCNTGMMFYVNWYDEDAQTQHTWSNITRTVILNNVSNDVFNYLTKNTCPASEYGADYDTNSCSIAPNWIIYRDGSFYEYDDTNRQWSVTSQGPEPTPPQPVDPLDSTLTITGPLTPDPEDSSKSIVYSQETQDVYMKSQGMTYDSDNNRYEFAPDDQFDSVAFFAPETHTFETITFVNLDSTYKAVFLQMGNVGYGVVTEDVDGNLRWSRTTDYDPSQGLEAFDFTQVIQQVGAPMTCEEIRITMAPYVAPEPELSIHIDCPSEAHVGEAITFNVYDNSDNDITSQCDITYDMSLLNFVTATDVEPIAEGNTDIQAVYVYNEETLTAIHNINIVAAAEPEQQSVILNSPNIRTANGTSETVIVARYPYNNVNPINTIDENLKMSLSGDPAIRCHNDSNYIKLEAGCSFTLESSVDQIAQVIITLNLAYDNDTSELDVQPNEDNQLVFAAGYGMSFSFSAGSTPLYFTQIEVIYGNNGAE